MSLRWIIVLVYAHEVISTESESKPWKKRVVWFTGEFMREHVAVNSRCTTTVFSNMANHSFNCFVNFSINDWKENVESLNNSPFWEETQSFICFCQLTVNETVFLSLLANAVNSELQRLRSRWALFISSAVFLAMLTWWHLQFSKIFPFLFFSVN